MDCALRKHSQKNMRLREGLSELTEKRKYSRIARKCNNFSKKWGERFEQLKRKVKR